MAKKMDDFEIEQDEVVSESEYRIRKPPAYRDMTDSQYLKCINRERFAMLAQTDRHSAVRYLKDNENFFRLNYSQDDKEILHRCIAQGGYLGLTHDDVVTVRDILGQLQPCKMKPWNTQYSDSEDRYHYKEPEIRLALFRESGTWTFEHFRRFWNNNKSNSKYIDSLDDDESNALCDAFEKQIHYGHCLSFQEPYDSEKDDDWIQTV